MMRNPNIGGAETSINGGVLLSGQACRSVIDSLLRFKPYCRVGHAPAVSLLALVIVGGMLWHVITVATVNRLPRQDVDGLPVYERMDAITKK